MKRLYVLRHAKSSWDSHSLPDHERPLAPRGRKALERIPRHIEREGISPSLVLCSTAVRARHTLEPLREALGHPPVEFEDDLYTASAAMLLRRLQTVGDDVESVLLVAHNPGLQELVLALAAPGELRDRAAAKLPTGAFATLELDGTWADLRPESTRLTGFAVPRELAR